MVLLDNFDVVVVAEHYGSLCGEIEKHVHSDAHIGSVKQRDFFSGVAELCLLLIAKTGCSHHQRNAVREAIVNSGIDGLGQGKIYQHIGFCRIDAANRHTD